MTQHGQLTGRRAGPGGLPWPVTIAVLEPALAKKTTGHLSYEKHDPAGLRIRQAAGNGTAGKTVLTDVGGRT